MIFQIILEIFLEMTHIILRSPGNVLLYYVFRREVALDDNSFAAYALGIVFWLMAAALIWLLVILMRI
jgi:hypothetical protein